MPESDFHKIWGRNPDGFGIAKYTENKKSVYFKKGIMDEKEAFELHNKFEFPFVCHWRKATVGDKSKKLTHPFIISKNSPLILEGEAEGVLFSNGTSGLWKDYLNATGIYPEKEDLCNWSDTRAIASIISNNNERFLNNLFVKFVVISIHNDKIYWYDGSNYMAFTEEDGIIFSNKLWDISEVNPNNPNFQVRDYRHYLGYPNIEHLKKKNPPETTQNIGASSTKRNYYISPFNYKKPWEIIPDDTEMILRYLLNKMTLKSSLKLWNKYKNTSKGLNWAQETALKIVKQQVKGFDYERIQRIIAKKGKNEPQISNLEISRLQNESPNYCEDYG